MRDDDFSAMVFKCKMRMTIEHEPHPRLDSLRRALSALMRGNWRSARIWFRSARTGKAMPYRGTLYGYTL